MGVDKPKLIPTKRFTVYQVKNDVKYYYIDFEYPAIVWRNVFIFLALHVFYMYGIYYSLVEASWSVWVFMYGLALLGGLGITAGAHRLWSHKTYKATLPLQIFLIICNCIAGQNDLIEWCRDHRLHHKASESDADPHNSNRGWFFAHIGWLLQRKHPKVLETGAKLDMSDLENDPVLIFQRRFYWPMFVLFGLALPITVCHYYLGATLFYSISISLWRYVGALHCTWLVNSAAHIWGDKPYHTDIEPRENNFVSYGALGEGFHNYHHTFPFDYSTSEFGRYFNITTAFIDAMAFIGLAYDRRSVSAEVIAQRCQRTGNKNVNKKQLQNLQHEGLKESIERSAMGAIIQDMPYVLA